MNVLIACEESQTVCKAFRERGHNAFSCDIISPSGGYPEWHIQDDVTDLLNGFCVFVTMDGKIHREMLRKKWDLIIGHPPCTFLSNAGSCRLYPHKGVLNRDRYLKGIKAREFFMHILNAECDKICVENPIPSRVYELPKYTQIIQPYEYGHPYTKKTCLWLKNLPELKPTNIVMERHPYICGNSKIWKKQAADGKVWGKEKSSKYRSKTFKGIAEAMAEQWGIIK